MVGRQGTGDRGSGEPWRSGSAAPSAAMLRALILALLWRGSLVQEPGYSLTVPRSVSVQEGLCVLVPCKFTYPAGYDTWNLQNTLYGHWFNGSPDVYVDPPVASSDPNRWVSQETRGRFRLAGDPARGDCSLQINDARRTDRGRYFLRVQRGTSGFSYRVFTGYTETHISVLGLTEEPEIQISPARGLPETLVAGEPVTVTCTAPGRCSGTPPRITWTGPSSDTARDVSARLENGTTAHSSALSFTPAPGDHGKDLVCTVTYPAVGVSTRRALRLQVGSPERTLQITVSRANRSGPQLFPDLSTPVANGSWFTAREGDSLRFLCSVASRSPAALTWVWGGRAINDTPSVGENRLRLELSNVTAEDGGLYRCQAQSRESSAQGMFQLLIEYSPRLGTRLNSSCQRQGSHVSCSCSLRSRPPPWLQWQVDGETRAGNSSWGALQVSSWADGDEAVGTLNWTGSADRGPRIFCLGSNPYGTYAALHCDLSPPQGVAEEPAWLLGLGVACGLGVAVGCFLLGFCVVKLRSRGLAPRSSAAKETANGTQGEHPADDAGLIYSNINNLPMDDTTLAGRRTKGIQERATAAQGPSGCGELTEVHYASIDVSKGQHKGGKPPEELATEYSEIRLK